MLGCRSGFYGSSEVVFVDESHTLSPVCENPRTLRYAVKVTAKITGTRGGSRASAVSHCNVHAIPRQHLLVKDIN